MRAKATLGQIAFEAYNSAGNNPGKTWDGKDVPTWDKLSDDVRAKWEVCVKHVETIALLQMLELNFPGVGAEIARHCRELLSEKTGVPNAGA